MLPQVMEFTDGNGNELRIINHSNERLERETIRSLEKDFNGIFSGISLKFRIEAHVIRYSILEIFSSNAMVSFPDLGVWVPLGTQYGDLAIAITGFIAQALEVATMFQDSPQLLEAIDSANAEAAETEGAGDDPEEDCDQPETAPRETPLPRIWNPDNLLREMDKDK